MVPRSQGSVWVSGRLVTWRIGFCCDPMTSTDQNYVDFLLAQIKADTLDSVLPLLQAGTIAIPSKEIYLAALEANTRRDDYVCEPYDIKSKSGFHAFMVGTLAVSVLDIHATHASLTPYLMKVEGPGVLVAALQNSSPDEVSTWLAANVPVSSAGSTGNQSGVLGMLVSQEATSVLNKIADLVPRWGEVLDSRGRSVLFYAKSAAAISSAVLAGASPAIKDASGKSLHTWWAANLPPETSSPMVAALQALGMDGAPTMADAMVGKLFHLDIAGMSMEEAAIFDGASRDPTWRWTGILEGASRTWTLEEIWRFGELAFLNDKIEAPKSVNLGRGGYVGSRGHSRREPDKIKNYIAVLRSTLPEEVSGAWFSSVPSPLRSPFLGMLSLATLTPSSCDPYEKDNSYRSNSSGHLNQLEASSLIKNAVIKLLSSWSPEEHAMLPSGLSELHDCRWAVSHHIFDHVVDLVVSGSKPMSMIDRAAWGAVMSDAPMKSPWHGSALLGRVYRALSTEQNDLSAIPPPLARALVKLVGTMPSGISSEVSRQREKADAAILKMLGTGVLDGQDIPSRWLRGFSPTSRSLLSQKLLSTKAAAARQAAEVPPAKPNRRM